MEESVEIIKKKLISYIDDENIELIITCLNSSYNYQKYFINLVEQIINSHSIGNIEYHSLLEKLNRILPNLIIQLGIPFCELLNNHKEIINYYYYLYINNDSIHKNILLNFIHIFNFESSEINPGDDLIEKLEMYNLNDINIIKNKKRKDKTEIENLYDEIISLFSNLRIRINIDDNFDEEILKDFDSNIKEKSEKINQIKLENKYPNAIIEFFQEKINNFKQLFNEININKNKKYPNTFNNNYKNVLFSPINNTIKFKSSIINKEIPNFSFNNNINLDYSDFNIEEELKKLREIPLKNRTSFYKDEQLVEGEDEFTEFKNYYLPLNQQKGEELKRQFCAFLNNKGGRLYLGINDLKVVKGVVLSYKKCDGLRNLLVNLTYDFYPKCRLDKIKVYFIPVKNMKNNKFINDLYVVKINVLQGEPNILYSMTSKGFHSTLRLQGQCANLTAEEISKEIIRRAKLGELYKLENLVNLNNNQFKDPEPEKNYENEINNDRIDIIMNNNNERNYENKNNKQFFNKNIQLNKRDIVVVEVKNIDKNLEIKEIYDKFKDCDSFYQKFFSINGKSRGYGLLKFSNENSAMSTIKKFDNLQIGEKRISLFKNKRTIF